MEVILLEKMRSLGALGEKVKVKAGFARNFLIPQGKAVYANKENIAKFEERRAELEKKAAEKHAIAIERLKQITDLGSITIKAKAGEEGKLFGSISNRDVAAAFEKIGVKMERRDIFLAEGTIRKIGEYEVKVEFESEATASIKLIIVPEA